jgi:uncharacterized protein YbjQ (UPF0145 family)
MAEPFWISTGNIREQYVPMRIVATQQGVPTQAFGKTDYSTAYPACVEALAMQAQKLGCNGVIWISFSPTVFPFGVFVLASGTAVKVIPPQTQ